MSDLRRKRPNENGEERPPQPSPRLPAELDDGGTTSLAELAAAVGMDPSSFESSRPTAPDGATGPPEPAPPLDGADSSAPTAGDADALAVRNYRRVYESRWHALPLDQRIGAARTAREPALPALCLDPDPRVIGALLQNAAVGLDEIRLIALHHRTGAGLEMIARRQEWLRDAIVERRLLHNPMLGEIVLGRIMNPKRLLPTYKIAIDRDVPELTRSKCRGILRQKWQFAPSDERADLLLRTEARCLAIMTGCTFDAKTTAILCGRPINSVMLVQSIAKFAASPPALLAHLFKQPFVRKNVPLKKMLLAHANMPGDVKRSI